MRWRGLGGGAVDWRRLEGHDNALNALRLVLATLVLVMHSGNALHAEAGPLPYLPSFAVDCFFGISGFLVAGSRMRLSLGAFLWRRALRILPGLWAALLFTAFLLAPVAALVQGSPFRWEDACSYILKNGSLLMTQTSIGETLGRSPVSWWNVSIWTLPYEALAYVVFGVVLTAKRFQKRSALAACALLSLITLVRWMPNSPLPEITSLLRFLSFFA